VIASVQGASIVRGGVRPITTWRRPGQIDPAP